MTLVAIHQPTFLPWLGWWDKFVRADVFVILDDIQFPKKGGTWMNRVRVLVNREPAWLTVPIDRSYHGTRSVREMTVDDAQPWREKLSKTIQTTYAQAPHFTDVQFVVQDVLHVPTNCIAALNEAGIRRLATELGLDASKLVRQSTLGPVNGTGTDLLVKLTTAVGGTAYLTGDGAGGYLEPQKFAAAGLDLVEQRFEHPRYAQPRGEFVPGLSIVDAAMSCGWQGTRELLERGG